MILSVFSRTDALLGLLIAYPEKFAEKKHGAVFRFLC